MTGSSEQNRKTNSGIDAKGIYVIFSQFILEVILFIGSAVFLGLYLDRKLGTKCIFLILFLFLFAFVPIVNLIKRMKAVNG